MIDYLKNLPKTSTLRKVVLTILGLVLGIVGCGFGMLACVAGCSQEWLFWLWEASSLILGISLISLGYVKSKLINLILLISTLTILYSIFGDHLISSLRRALFE